MTMVTVSMVESRHHLLEKSMALATQDRRGYGLPRSGVVDVLRQHT